MDGVEGMVVDAGYLVLCWHMQGGDVRSLDASACMNLSLEHASTSSGPSHASSGSCLSTMRSSDARLFV